MQNSNSMRLYKTFLLIFYEFMYLFVFNMKVALSVWKRKKGKYRNEGILTLLSRLLLFISFCVSVALRVMMIQFSVTVQKERESTVLQVGDTVVHVFIL